jgi:outer membrane murein-binding lipoprotein Lpp
MRKVDKHRLVVFGLAAALGFASLGASSCDTSTKEIDKAQHDLNKASKGLDALTATCKHLRNDPQAAHDFDQSAAKDANRSDESLSATAERARQSRERHCAQSQNPTYQPYTDVSVDISQ